ncbi:MAG: MFS transporter, partial [Pseudomonadota bacterium]|nr:MFS transporter [Pseudomonadota bacterium]
LGFSETTLVWVVNAYLLTCGGFLLLGGRLGDLYGHRRVFMVGIVLFTGASLACGLASAQVPLVIARAVQGIGGAIVDAVALALLMHLFTEAGERARAMGVYGFVCAGGGSIGVLLGGVLTDVYDWHWVFLVNLPIGVAVIGLSIAVLPAAGAAPARPRLDVAGALTVTAALMLAVYAIVGANGAGWGSPRTLGLLVVAAALFAIFIAIEARVAQPLMPLRLFSSTTLNAANAIGILWSAAMFAWFFLSALYLQRVLGCTAMQVGLAFLPSNIIMAVCSLGLSARVVTRFGLRRPLVFGLFCAAAGLALFARAPVEGHIAVDVLPGMILLGLGAGIAFNPLLLAAMSDVAESESGLASGIVNTSFMMGGALGLAVLASLAALYTDSAGARGAAEIAALNAGYRLAFGVGAVCALVAAGLGALLLPMQAAAPAHARAS